MELVGLVGLVWFGLVWSGPIWFGFVSQVVNFSQFPVISSSCSSVQLLVVRCRYIFPWRYLALRCQQTQNVCVCLCIHVACKCCLSSPLSNKCHISYFSDSWPLFVIQQFARFAVVLCAIFLTRFLHKNAGLQRSVRCVEHTKHMGISEVDINSSFSGSTRL